MGDPTLRVNTLERLGPWVIYGGMGVVAAELAAAEYWSGILDRQLFGAPAAGITTTLVIFNFVAIVMARSSFSEHKLAPFLSSRADRRAQREKAAVEMGAAPGMLSISSDGTSGELSISGGEARSGSLSQAESDRTRRDPGLQSAPRNLNFLFESGCVLFFTAPVVVIGFVAAAMIGSLEGVAVLPLFGVDDAHATTFGAAGGCVAYVAYPIVIVLAGALRKGKPSAIIPENRGQT